MVELHRLFQHPFLTSIYFPPPMSSTSLPGTPIFACLYFPPSMSPNSLFCPFFFFFARVGAAHWCSGDQCPLLLMFKHWTSMTSASWPKYQC